jgi:hypothetical protein
MPENRTDGWLAEYIRIQLISARLLYIVIFAVILIGGTYSCLMFITGPHQTGGK